MVGAIVQNICKHVQRKSCLHFIETGSSLYDYNVRVCHGGEIMPGAGEGHCHDVCEHHSAVSWPVCHAVQMLLFMN